MKSKIVLLLALFFAIYSYSQYEIKVNLKDGVFEILPPVEVSPKDLGKDPGRINVLYIPNSNNTKRLSNSEIYDEGFSAITYLIKEDEIDGKLGAALIEIKDQKQLAEGKFALVVEKGDSKFIFSIKTKKNGKIIDQGERKEMFYCKEADNFQKDRKDCSKDVNKNSQLRIFDDIIKIPYPKFDYERNGRTNWNKHNRNLYIDANPNPISNSSVQLRKGELKNDKYDDEETYSVHKKGNITVFISSLNINEVNELDLNIDGVMYSYNKDLSDLLNQSKKSESEESQNKLQDATALSPTDSLSLKILRKTRTEFLKEVLEYYRNVNALSKDDINILNQFKADLDRTVYSQDIDLDQEGRSLLSDLMSWFPKYIGLTPISPKIGDNDEIELSIGIEYKNKPKVTIPLQSYKVNGGVSFDLGGAFFFTGLKNNRVFTEEVGEGDESQLLAKIDEENQLSVGFGLNSEVSFRTGDLFRPTINIGAFIPFEEEISPYLTIGPGVGLYDKKLKINLLAGLAVGKVNAIKAEFIEKDLSDMDNLTNESISAKVWDTSWFIGIGIRYKLKDDK